MRLSRRQLRSATHRVDDIADRLDEDCRREQVDFVAGCGNCCLPRVVDDEALRRAARLATQIHARVKVDFVSRGDAGARRTAEDFSRANVLFAWWPTVFAGGILFGSVA